MKHYALHKSLENWCGHSTSFTISELQFDSFSFPKILACGSLLILIPYYTRHPFVFVSVSSINETKPLRLEMKIRMTGCAYFFERRSCATVSMKIYHQIEIRTECL